MAHAMVAFSSNPVQTCTCTCLGVLHKVPVCRFHISSGLFRLIEVMLGARKLRTWLRESGIEWESSLLAVQARGAGCGFGVWALQDVSEGTVLCRIPKCAILSRRTTRIADILESEKIAGGLGLTIASMYEATCTTSPW